jgi:hypothetical protein
MKKNNFIFNLCLDSGDLIAFIEMNTGWDWNDICDMEYKYRHSDIFETSNPYPIINLGETDETTFQYWVERFLEEFADDIGNNTVYIIQ